MWFSFVITLLQLCIDTSEVIDPVCNRCVIPCVVARLDPILYKKCQGDASQLCHTHGWNETSDMLPTGAIFSCLYRHAYRSVEQGRRVSVCCRMTSLKDRFTQAYKEAELSLSSSGVSLQMSDSFCGLGHHRILNSFLPNVENAEFVHVVVKG